MESVYTIISSSIIFSTVLSIPLFFLYLIIKNIGLSGKNQYSAIFCMMIVYLPVTVILTNNSMKTAITTTNTVHKINSEPIITELEVLSQKSEILIKSDSIKKPVIGKSETSNQYKMILFYLWSTGIIFVLMKYFFKLKTINTIKNEATLCTEKSINLLLKKCTLKLNIKKRIILKYTTDLLSPFVSNIFHTTIYLPTSLMTSIPVNQLEAILLHELAHIKRLDHYGQQVITLFEILFYYNPIIIYIAKDLKKIREFHCDEMAISHSSSIHLSKALIHLEEYKITQLSANFKSNNTIERIHKMLNLNTSNEINPIKTLFIAAILVTMMALPLMSTQAKDNIEKKSSTKTDNQIKQPLIVNAYTISNNFISKENVEIASFYPEICGLNKENFKNRTSCIQQLIELIVTQNKWARVIFKKENSKNIKSLNGRVLINPNKVKTLVKIKKVPALSYIPFLRKLFNTDYWKIDINKLPKNKPYIYKVGTILYICQTKESHNKIEKLITAYNNIKADEQISIQFNIQSGEENMKGPNLCVFNSTLAHIYSLNSRSYIADYKKLNGFFDPIIKQANQGIVLCVRIFHFEGKNYLLDGIFKLLGKLQMHETSFNTHEKNNLKLTIHSPVQEVNEFHIKHPVQIPRKGLTFELDKTKPTYPLTLINKQKMITDERVQIKIKIKIKAKLIKFKEVLLLK